MNKLCVGGIVQIRRSAGYDNAVDSGASIDDIRADESIEIIVAGAA